jgi:hypothetical protein
VSITLADRAQTILDALDSGCDREEVRRDVEALLSACYSREPRRSFALVSAPHISYSKNSVSRPDQADPAAWTPLPDGAWRSPRGRIYTHPRIVLPLVARRMKLGLPIAAEEPS